MAAAKPLPVKFCKHCGETFRQKRKWQDYCSNRCRITAFALLQQATAERDAKRRLELEDENLKLQKRVQELEAELARKIV
jgi:hypothetical protein